MDISKVNLKASRVHAARIVFPCECGRVFEDGEAGKFCPDCGRELSELVRLGSITVAPQVLASMICREARHELAGVNDKTTATTAHNLLKGHFNPLPFGNPAGKDGSVPGERWA